MKLFTNQPNYTIYNGSMLNLLDVIEPNSIDSVVTDPPYELNFMGKGWDSSGIAFQPDTWRKCYEALKPGGYLLAFGGSRTFHRIACAIEDAGFELRDTILYLYGSGFPKSHNIGLAIDKKMGVKGEKYIDENFLKRNPNKLHYDESINNGFKDGLDSAVRYKVTNQWQGWGTALKPAFEPIIVARKPFRTSVAENIMEYGVGGINIDGCRVGTEEITQEAGKIKSNGTYGDQVWNAKTSIGRFPANVIHDGSDEVVSLFPEVKSGTAIRINSGGNTFGGDKAKPPMNNLGYDDNGGSASRFFYTAKASKKDRDEGLKLTNLQKVNDGRNTPIDNAFQRGETFRKNTHPTVKPCELMQYLVRLVSPKGATILDPFMGSGSTGKAVMFENRERNAGYKFIGIDLEKEYCDIAEARIDYALNKYVYDAEEEKQIAEAKGQLSLF